MGYTHLEFRADYPREPGDAGREVMALLASAMRHAGFTVAPPIAEDWGWACSLSRDGFSLLLGCGAYAEYADGWLCFVEGTKVGLKRWLQPKAALAVGERAVAVMQAAVAADPGCHDLKWWTDGTGVGLLVDAA